jgi:hypothetical protein
MVLELWHDIFWILFLQTKQQYFCHCKLLVLLMHLNHDNSQKHYLNPAWFTRSMIWIWSSCRELACWRDCLLIMSLSNCSDRLPRCFLVSAVLGVQDFMRRLGLDLLITPLDDTVGSKQGNQIQQRAVVCKELAIWRYLFFSRSSSANVCNLWPPCKNGCFT